MLTLNNYFLGYKGKNRKCSGKNQLEEIFFREKNKAKRMFFYRLATCKQPKKQKHSDMSADNPERSTENLFFRFIGSDAENQAILFEEIKKELGAFLAKESDDKDVADGIFEFLSTISESFQEELD